MSGLHVVFKVADADYVLPASEVLHMETFGGATKVPGAPPHVAGLMQIRRRVVLGQRARGCDEQREGRNDCASLHTVFPYSASYFAAAAGFASSSFHRFQPSSRACLFSFDASVISPARMKPCPAPA